MFAATNYSLDKEHAGPSAFWTRHPFHPARSTFCVSATRVEIAERADPVGPTPWTRMEDVDGATICLHIIRNLEIMHD